MSVCLCLCVGRIVVFSLCFVWLCVDFGFVVAVCWLCIDFVDVCSVCGRGVFAFALVCCGVFMWFVVCIDVSSVIAWVAVC